jgi:hypothetical protein
MGLSAEIKITFPTKSCTLESNQGLIDSDSPIGRGGMQRDRQVSRSRTLHVAYQSRQIQNGEASVCYREDNRLLVLIVAIHLLVVVAAIG